MGTLTPRKVSHPTEVSPLHVTRRFETILPSITQRPPSPLSHATPQLDGSPLSGSRLHHWLAGSPVRQAESSSSHCGLVSHLRLLSTPPLGDAVTFGFQAGERMPGEDSHLYTCALAGAPARGASPGGPGPPPSQALKGRQIPRSIDRSEESAAPTGLRGRGASFPWGWRPRLVSSGLPPVSWTPQKARIMGTEVSYEED